MKLTRNQRIRNVVIGISLVVGLIALGIILDIPPDAIRISIYATFSFFLGMKFIAKGSITILRRKKMASLSPTKIENAKNGELIEVHGFAWPKANRALTNMKGAPVAYIEYETIQPNEDGKYFTNKTKLNDEIYVFDETSCLETVVDSKDPKTMLMSDEYTATLLSEQQLAQLALKLQALSSDYEKQSTDRIISDLLQIKESYVIAGAPVHLCGNFEKNKNIKNNFSEKQKKFFQEASLIKNKYAEKNKNFVHYNDKDMASEYSATAQMHLSKLKLSARGRIPSDTDHWFSATSEDKYLLDSEFESVGSFLLGALLLILTLLMLYPLLFI